MDSKSHAAGRAAPFPPDALVNLAPSKVRFTRTDCTLVPPLFNEIASVTASPGAPAAVPINDVGLTGVAVGVGSGVAIGVGSGVAAGRGTDPPPPPPKLGGLVGGGVTITVCIGVGAGVAGRVGVGVGVGVGASVGVGVGVSVGEGVGVGTEVGVAVAVGTGVRVGVARTIPAGIVGGTGSGVGVAVGIAIIPVVGTVTEAGGDARSEICGVGAGMVGGPVARSLPSLTAKSAITVINPIHTPAVANGTVDSRSLASW